MNFFKNNLKYLRRKLGVSQQELALKVNKRHTTIGNWENGASEPNVQEIIEIANYFTVSLDNLILADLEKCNLITDEQVSNFQGKMQPNLQSNMQSKRQNNANKPADKAVHKREGSSPKEAEELTMWVVLKELRQVSQKIDVMGVSVAEIAHNTAPKKR